MKKILIVEDSKTINNVIKKNVEKIDFIPYQAFDLKTARDILNKEEIDIVILDMHLPDGEGIELIDEIKEFNKNSKIIVLTSLNDISLREELFKQGIVDYIIKDSNLLYSLKEVLKILKNIDKKRGDILIIDDSKFIHKQIEKVLIPRNYKLKSVYSAKDAQNVLKRNHFDLILLDMELPDMHGIELISIIRKIDDMVPIIVLSAYLTSEMIRDILKRGGNDFLKKPFVFEEFILRVDLWYEYYITNKELEKKTFELNKMNSYLQKRIEEEIENSRKKDSLMSLNFKQAQMGEMMSLIVHQWKQPLNVLSLGTSYLQLMLKNNKCDLEKIEDITKRFANSIKYLNDTIDDFKNFFSPNKDVSYTNFKKAIDKTLNIIKPVLDFHNIEVNIFVNELEDFLTSENELIQVLMNIIGNAKDVLKDKDEKVINIVINGRTIEIEDSGGGIDENLIDKIFDYGTTSKKEGSGLGLYMSKIIIEENLGGKIYVKNSQKGAKFIIEL